MKQGKALIISVVVTLLVSIGVIAFNASYAGNSPEPAAIVTAESNVDRTTRLTLVPDEDEGSWSDDGSGEWDDDDEHENDDEHEAEDDDDEHAEDDD